MPRKTLLLILVLTLAAPPALFADILAAYPRDLQTAEDAPGEEVPEEEPQISGRTQLLLGLSMSFLGTALIITGELYRTPFQEAKDNYFSIGSGKASVAEVEAARKEFTNKRLLHYIPLFGGIGLTGFGLFLTFEGAFSVDIYEARPYTPNPVIPDDQSGILFSRDFTGVVIKY